MIFRQLDFSNPTEVQAVAKIHVISPCEWDPAHKISEEGIANYAKWLSEKKTQLWCELAVAGDEIKAMHLLVLNDSKTVATILSLWVSEDCRRQGVASRMKLAGEEWVKSLGLNKLNSSVYVANKKMQALNEKLGFKPLKIEYEKVLP